MNRMLPVLMLMAFVSCGSPKAAPGAVEVSLSSEPEGANVFSAGRPVERTPCRIVLQPGEKRVVTLVMKGYEAQELLLEYPPDAGRGKPAVIEKKVRLVSTARAAVTIISEPPGIEILMDGARVGSTPKRISDLAAGKHLIVLSHPDYVQEEREVALGPGEHKDVSVTMRDRTVEYLRGMIAQKPLMMDNYSQLAHCYIIRGQFDLAEKTLREGFAKLQTPGCQAKKEFFYELRDIYIRQYNYPRTPASQNLRKLCWDLAHEALERNLYDRFNLEQMVIGKMRNVPL